MTREEFAQRITAMEGTLYRIAATILRQQCDREDAVQSAILTAWRKQNSLRDEGKFEPWVIRILMNVCYAQVKKKKREVSLEKVAEFAAPMGGDVDLYRFFVGLPEKLRMVMVLFYVEGYDIMQISEILHVPAGTVKSRLARGRERMRRDFELEEVQGK